MRVLALLLLLFLALIAAPACAADKSSGDAASIQGAHLACFSVTPPRDAPSSCDALCAGKGAACTGVTLNGALNPGIACETVADPKYLADTVAGCRCCALAGR